MPPRSFLSPFLSPFPQGSWDPKRVYSAWAVTNTRTGYPKMSPQLHKSLDFDAAEKAELKSQSHDLKSKALAVFIWVKYYVYFLRSYFGLLHGRVRNHQCLTQCHSRVPICVPHGKPVSPLSSSSHDRDTSKRVFYIGSVFSTYPTLCIVFPRKCLTCISI